MVGKLVIIRIEPSKRLSELLGFPFYVERKFPAESFTLSKNEIAKLESGQEICKQIKIEEVNNEGNQDLNTATKELS